MEIDTDGPILPSGSLGTTAASGACTDTPVNQPSLRQEPRPLPSADALVTNTLRLAAAVAVRPLEQAWHRTPFASEQALACARATVLTL